MHAPSLGPAGAQILELRSWGKHKALLGDLLMSELRDQRPAVRGKIGEDFLIFFTLRKFSNMF